jgi:hypothetical protein
LLAQQFTFSSSFEKLEPVAQKKGNELTQDFVFPDVVNQELEQRLAKVNTRVVLSETRLRECLVKETLLIRITKVLIQSSSASQLCYSSCSLLRFACTFGLLEIVRAYFDRLDEVYLTCMLLNFFFLSIELTCRSSEV